MGAKTARLRLVIDSGDRAEGAIRARTDPRNEIELPPEPAMPEAAVTPDDAA